MSTANLTTPIGSSAVPVPNNSTVKTIIEAAGIRLGPGAEIRINGCPVEINRMVLDGDNIVISNLGTPAAATPAAATFSVFVTPVPGTRTEVVVREGMTVKQAVEGAGLSLSSGSEIRVNNCPKDCSTVVSARDEILIFRTIRGNAATFSVFVTPVPGTRTEVVVREGMTVKQAVEGAGLSLSSGSEIRVNNCPKDCSTVVSARDEILIFRTIRGNKGC